MNRNDAIDFLKRKPAKYGHMLGFKDLTDIHNGWIRDMLLGKGDITKQASRGTYKTTCVSIALALVIILLPNKTSLFMRKTDGDVKEVIKQVQKIIADPHTQYFVQSIYGVNLKQTSQTQTEITTNLTNTVRGTAQLLGIGIGSSITGKHFDRIFTDDIVNINDRISRAERERTKTIYQELQNVKNRGGRIINTGTPWHKEDCFTIMPEPEKWDCYSIGLFTQEQLDDIRSKMSPSLFAANYELRHIAVENLIFPDPNLGGDPAMVEQGIAHIDAAYYGEDFTAFTVCRKVDEKYYVYGRMWQKHVDDVEEEIIALREKFNAGKIYCENNGDKGYLAKQLKAKGERAVTYHESMNKHLKITTYLKEAWDSVIFVEGTDEEYIAQVCDYDENAEHDDAPDSLASAIRILWKKKGQAYTPLWS